MSEAVGVYPTWDDPGLIDERIPNAFQATHRLIVGELLDACVEEAANPEAPIIEVGAGLGALGEIIEPTYTAQYVQTDLSPRYVAASKARNPHLTSLTADVSWLPFARNSAGMVIARNLFDMLPQAQAAAHEIHDVLMPNGSFIHLHDRRPNIGHVIRSIRELVAAEDEEEVVFLPGVSNDTLAHLRVVAREDYETAHQQWSVEDQALMRTYAQAPAETMEYMRAHLPQQVDYVAAVAKSIPGFDTPTFSELFSNQMVQILRQAGFAAYAMTLQAEAKVSQKVIGHLFGDKYLEGYKQSKATHKSNILTMSPDGRYELAYHDLNTPKGMIRQIGMLNVILAQKVD